MQDNFSIRDWKNTKLYKEEYEGALTTEANTPRYPEGELSIEDKIKAITPLWNQYQSASGDEADKIKEKISRYTTYDNPNGGGSYVWYILDNAKSVEDVARIIKKEEDRLKKDGYEESDYTVKLLVPKVYFNVESGELSDNKNEWYTDDELRAGADQTSYTKGSELDDIVFSGDYDQALDFAKRYPTLIKVVKDSVQEQDELEDDDIELEIPGDESTAVVDKSADVKARGKEAKMKQAKAEFKRLEDQMKTHLELYKTSESEENKKTALQMLKNLTPEFQAAKKAYEKLKGVKL